MLPIDDQREETEPAWAEAEPPRLDLFCSGVLYTEVPVPVLLELLRRAEIQGVIAAMGPGLFFGREDGPFVPYDLSLTDQNEEKKVRDRAFPWCWGDVLWVIGYWQGMRISLRLAKMDGTGDVFGALRASAYEMEEAVLARARATAGKLLARVREELFLEGLRGVSSRGGPPGASSGRR